MTRGFCAFLDLVGMRHLATWNHEAYWEALNRFQKHVVVWSHLLRPPDERVYFFSDCIFVTCKTPSRLISFLTALRHELLLDGYYFKAAVSSGALAATEAHVNPSVRGRRRELQRVVRGNYFGIRAAYLFGLQERMKGIGTFIDYHEFPKAFLAKHTTWSCFLPSVRRRQAVEYRDLVLLEKDLTSDILNRILRDFLKAKSASRKVGRFYVSLLVLWVQSLPLAQLDYGHSMRSEFVVALLDGSFESLFADVVGVEYIYYALLNRVLEEREHVARPLLDDVQKYFYSRKWLLKYLENAPANLLASAVRDEFLVNLSRGVLAGSRKERVTSQFMMDLILNGKSDREIAELLNQEGHTTRHHKSWTAGSVASFRRRKLPGIKKLSK